MTKITERRSYARIVLAAGSIFGLAGCSSPPSLIPTLKIVQESLEREAQNIQSISKAQDEQYFETIRQDLKDAFRQDLYATPELTPEWVEAATAVYVAANEQLWKNQISRAAQRNTRIENLRLASQAQAQAVAILEQQDRLYQRLGFDLGPAVLPHEEHQP